MGREYDLETKWLAKNGIRSEYIELLQTKPCTILPERNQAESRRKDNKRMAKRQKKAAKKIEQIALQVAIGLQEIHQSYF